MQIRKSLKKKQDNLEPVNDIEAHMVLSIKTENTLERLLEQLDSALGKKTVNMKL